MFSLCEMNLKCVNQGGSFIDSHPRFMLRRELSDGQFYLDEVREASSVFF